MKEVTVYIYIRTHKTIYYYVYGNHNWGIEPCPVLFLTCVLGFIYMNGRFFFHFLKISTKWKGSHTEKTQASILDYVAFPKNFVQFLCESCKISTFWTRASTTFLAIASIHAWKNTSKSTCWVCHCRYLSSKQSYFTDYFPD